ncbi:hypothetical protein RIR_jg11169.t2 [Rhizophagus irregularis DAOM 181602=DAOM 197198]|nr:hypothetical protein RIR_jg11169.t2 [Rhizophagus irregularis DAOM 181602=DAOM 197198]
MNSQQNSLQCKKIIVLLLMQEFFKKKNRVFNANTHLLTFTQVTSNAAFPYFTHLNLRASQQKRPKTDIRTSSEIHRFVDLLEPICVSEVIGEGKVTCPKAQ